MTPQELLEKERELWGNRPMTLEHIVTAIGVVYGDICRQARAKLEAGEYDEQELKKELGNLITSTIRWCDDLGYDPIDCIQLSLDAQARYTQRGRLSQDDVIKAE